jgi:hypothetical protein
VAIGFKAKKNHLKKKFFFLSKFFFLYLLRGEREKKLGEKKVDTEEEIKKQGERVKE